MRPLALALALLTLAVAAPSAVAADPAVFETPSRNIACFTIGSLLRCDMRKLGNKPAPKPKSCDFDYGRSFGVRKTSKRGTRLCISDAVGGPGTPRVAYGRTWRRNGFACRVRRSGLRCTNKGGHGFELRLGRQRLF